MRKIGINFIIYRSLGVDVIMGACLRALLAEVTWAWAPTLKASFWLNLFGI